MFDDRGWLLARAIADAHSLDASRMHELRGMGSVNHVFVVDAATTADGCVIRFAADPLRQNEFRVESWALAQAAAHGIPSPAVVAEGSLDDVPYLIQTFVSGVPGSEVRSTELWRTLGEYARTIHAIPLTSDAPQGLFSRFGRDLPAAWDAHLAYNLDQLEPSDPLIALGAYDAHQRLRLRETIAELRSEHWSFGLSHGDLSVRNLLVTPGERPVLIDWGSTSAGPVPFNDLLTLVKAHRADGDPSIVELEAFADGCGTRLSDVGNTLTSLMQLSALDLVRWAIDQRPDLVSEVVASARQMLAT